LICSYSREGTRHRQAGIKNQDAVTFRRSGKESVIVLADGVSSCSCAQEGAKRAGDTAADLLLSRGKDLLACSGEETGAFIVSQVVYELTRLAQEEKRAPEDYASTLAAVYYDSKTEKLLYCSLGDSLILAAGKGQCTILAQPSDSRDGCCVTMTRNAEKGMQTGMSDARLLDTVCLFSDGAWKVLFEGGSLKTAVRTMLVNGWYEDLQEYLQAQNCEDDHSFIAIDLKRKARRKAA
jgi:serine/threonine protein phosphatase PrpC